MSEEERDERLRADTVHDELAPVEDPPTSVGGSTPPAHSTVSVEVGLLRNVLKDVLHAEGILDAVKELREAREHYRAAGNAYMRDIEENRRRDSQLRRHEAEIARLLHEHGLEPIKDPPEQTNGDMQ